MSQFLPTTAGQLQALLRLQGTGFDATQRHAELNVQVDSKDFTLAPALQAQVRATLDGQAIQLPTLQVRSAPATLEASGMLSAAQQVALRYTLTLNDLQSLRDALGLAVQAKGSITGEVQGMLPALQVRSTVQLQEWAAAGLSGKQLRATLSAAHFPIAPQATLMARLAGVQGPALPASALTLQGVYRAPRATLSVAMTAGPYVQSRLFGHVNVQDGLRFTLERFRVRRGNLTWETAKPVEVQRDPQGTLRLSELLLRSRTQTLRVQGTLTAQGMVDVTVQSQRLQLQSIVHVFAPETAFPSGQLATDMTVRGTLQQPHITGTVALTMLRWQEQEWGEIRARFDTQGHTLSTDLRWQDRARELLQVSGTVGLDAAHALALQVHTRDMDMARLPLLSSAILASAGALTVDALLTGTLQQPLAHGQLTLRNGALQLAIAGERYKDIQVQLAFAGNRVEIEHLQVGSRSGNMQVNGWLETAGLAIAQLNVGVRADRFTAMHTPEAEAVVSAGIALHGSLQDLSATGKVSIPRARVLMSGKLWGRPADVQPWELTVAGVYGAGPKGTSNSTGNHTDLHKPVPLPFLRVDLSVDMPRNVWVQGNGTAVEISGTMRVRKAAKEPFILDGTIETVRGFASFYGKKFVVQEGRVNFPGSEELNPFLDVTVTQTVANYAVSIHIGGKARQPSITLSSTPDLPQAEIASLLVLGRTSEQRLTNSEQSALSGQVQQIIGDVAAGELEKTISQPLGLDTVEVEAGQTLGTGRVSVGRYVTQDIFLSYERQVGGEGENKVNIEYSINRRLKVKGSGSDTRESALDLLWHLDY
jgi:autotransporter translocation and assembly factor TamB